MQQEQQPPQQQAIETTVSNRKTYRNFIFNDIDRQILEAKFKENSALVSKKIRKSMPKKKFLVKFVRINQIMEKFQNDKITNAVKSDNFSEEEHSQNSASYMEMEQVHQIQRELQSMQQSYEKQLLDQQLKLKYDYEKQLLDLKHQRAQEPLLQEQPFESQLKEQQTQQLQEQKIQLQTQLNEQKESFQNQLTQLQRKLDQYESQESKDVVKCLTEFNNYSRAEKTQNKMLSFLQKIRFQKYNENKLIKDEGDVEYQILAQITFRLEKLMESQPNSSSSNSNSYSSKKTHQRTTKVD